MQVTKTTRKIPPPTTTPMAPSRGFLSRLFSSTAASEGEMDRLIGNAQEVFPVSVPEEKNLYFIPETLSPIYRPVPPLLKAATWLASAVFVAWTSQKPLLWLQNYMVALHQWRKVLWYVLKTSIFASLSTFLLQETPLYAPSRVAVGDLPFLPSKLSSYECINVSLSYLGDCQNETACLGVHYLECPGNSLQTTTATKPKYDALYVNHGFGASSLSWLPALPPLVDRLGVGVGLGHDAAGFGFTERSKELALFTPQGSAQIGLGLLRSKNLDSDCRVLVMGHSMGAITALHMALGLSARNVTTDVVLVSPALGLQTQKKGELKRVKWSFGLRSLLEAPGAYVLRRIVGSRNSWRSGLQSAWGDPKRLKDSDVLRFQWPSIGQGWEGGLFAFSRAQSMPVSMTDRELLDAVVKQPNTNVYVVLSSNDKVVPPQRIKSFFNEYDTVKVVEMDGLGHDPFEEDVQGFVETVESLLL